MEDKGQPFISWDILVLLLRNYIVDARTAWSMTNTCRRLFFALTREERRAMLFGYGYSPAKLTRNERLLQAELERNLIKYAKKTRRDISKLSICGRCIPHTIFHTGNEIRHDNKCKKHAANLQDKFVTTGSTGCFIHCRRCNVVHRDLTGRCPNQKKYCRMCAKKRWMMITYNMSRTCKECGFTVAFDMRMIGCYHCKFTCANCQDKITARRFSIYSRK